MTDQHDTRFVNFLEDFNGGIRERQIGSESDGPVQGVIPREEAVTGEFLERITDGSDLPDMNPVSFPLQKIGNANAQANAYNFSEVDQRLDLVVTLLKEPGEQDDSPPFPPADLRAAAKRALHVYRSAAKPVHEQMEPSSTSVDMFQLIHENHEEIRDIRIVILVEGTTKPIDFEPPEGFPPVRLDVWDHVRIQRVCTSGLPYEPVSIQLQEYLDQPLPMINSGVEAVDYECYFTILPGDLLHDLYDEYGPRLMELNVRSFLQARNKVNKGIRETLKNDPDHFLIFNNGINATVEEIEFGQREDGTPGITAIRGLQIVNGGQTTASIFRAKKLDGADLSRVRVQAKITVVKPDFLEALVPDISKYSNAQTAVNETDFSANKPYHRNLEQLSSRVWAPGEVTRWYYERSRGQYEVARNREGTTPARKKAFDAKTPKKQKFDKALLAKSENSWGQQPHVVSLGTQKNFKDFMDRHADSVVDEAEYRNIVARLILFKSAEKAARQLRFSAYRANAITYTVALLAYRTRGRINLDQIWKDQDISDAIRGVLLSWMPEVHESIMESAISQGRNVTEWAKKPECWAIIQNLDLELPKDFEDTLGEGLPKPNVGAYRKGDGGDPLTEPELQRQQAVMAMSADDFAALFKRVSRYLDSHGMQYVAWNAMVGCITTVQIYAENGWTKVPTPKQTRQIFKALDFLKEREEESEEGDG